MWGNRISNECFCFFNSLGDYKSIEVFLSLKAVDVSVSLGFEAMIFFFFSWDIWGRIAWGLLLSYKRLGIS